MKIVAVGNLKGGVGKTTIAVSLACALAGKNRVVLVDADGQASASEWLTAPPAGVTVSAWPLEANSTADVRQWAERVQGLRKTADLVVIDLPPHLSAVTGVAIGMADLVVIPCGPSVADVRATAKTVEILREVRQSHRGRPSALLVANRIDHRSTTGRSFGVVLDGFKEHVADDLVTRQAHADATASGQWIGDFAPTSDAAEEARVLARRVAKLLKGVKDE